MAAFDLSYLTKTPELFNAPATFVHEKSGDVYVAGFHFNEDCYVLSAETQTWKKLDVTLPSSCQYHAACLCDDQSTVVVVHKKGVWCGHLNAVEHDIAWQRHTAVKKKTGEKFEEISTFNFGFYLEFAMRVLPLQRCDRRSRQTVIITGGHVARTAVIIMDMSVIDSASDEPHSGTMIFEDMEALDDEKVGEITDAGARSPLPPTQWFFHGFVHCDSYRREIRGYDCAHCRSTLLSAIECLNTFLLIRNRKVCVLRVCERRCSECQQSHFDTSLHDVDFELEHYQGRYSGGEDRRMKDINKWFSMGCVYSHLQSALLCFGGHIMFSGETDSKLASRTMLIEIDTTPLLRNPYAHCEVGKALILHDWNHNFDRILAASFLDKMPSLGLGDSEGCGSSDAIVHMGMAYAGVAYDRMRGLVHVVGGVIEDTDTYFPAVFVDPQGTARRMPESDLHCVVSEVGRTLDLYDLERLVGLWLRINDIVSLPKELFRLTAAFVPCRMRVTSVLESKDLKLDACFSEVKVRSEQIRSASEDQSSTGKRRCLIM